jgi:hypothetical protein
MRCSTADLRYSAGYGLVRVDPDDIVERVEQRVREMSHRVPSRYGSEALVLRPSRWLLVPLFVLFLGGAVAMILVPGVGVGARLLAIPPLGIAAVLGVQLWPRCITITGRTVTDRTWRGESTIDGSCETYTLLDGPALERLAFTRRHRARAIVWRDLGGASHTASLDWFSEADRLTVIAAIRALEWNQV